MRNRTPKHGHTVRRHKSPEYIAWDNAKQRCTNPKVKNYYRYGGRGIEFRFASFVQFFGELGPRPEGTSLDRIDNDGHYEPGNVRWATKAEQTANRPWRSSGLADESNGS